MCPTPRIIVSLGVVLAFGVKQSVGDCFGTEPLVFYDIEKGDMKQMTLRAVHSFDFTIAPYKNSESWEIHGTFDENCSAMIDFHVPGNPSYPPVNLSMT